MSQKQPSFRDEPLFFIGGGGGGVPFLFADNLLP